MGAPGSRRYDRVVHPEPVEPEAVEPDLEPGIGPRRHTRWDVGLVVAAGGGLGGLARLGLNTIVPKNGAGFPWATFGENVIGCFLIGLLLALVVEVWPPTRYARAFLGTGILGGFTTFSAYTADARVLLQGGHSAEAFSYLFGTLAMGLVAVTAGLGVVRSLAGRRER